MEEGGKEREDVAARWWVYEERRTEKRESGRVCTGERRERGRASPACIRYLSRRCCVQVNKLTRRRASAIFFPINLNLLLTLFPYPSYPSYLLPLPRTTPFSRRYLPRSLRLFVSTIDVLVESYSFLISRRFSVFLRAFAPFLSLFLSATCPSRGLSTAKGKKRKEKENRGDDGIVYSVLRHVEPVSASTPD